MSPAFSMLLALAGPPLADQIASGPAAAPATATAPAKPAPPSLELLLFVGQGLDQLPYLPAKPKAAADAKDKVMNDAVSQPAQETARVARSESVLVHPQSTQDRTPCATASCSR